MNVDQFPTWDRNTRTPVPAPPHNSCDCQFHIFADAGKYPPIPTALYQPPRNATFADARIMLAKLGFSRGVIVYPMPYDTDARLLFDTLEGLSADERQCFRATAIIKDNVADATIERLNALGVRGTRFNIGKKYRESVPLTSVKRSMDRAREIGWHVKLHIDGDDIMEIAGFLDDIKNLTVVIDHMAHLRFAAGLDQPACRWILEKLKNDANWWMMCSNGNRDSTLESGYDDAVPFGEAFVAAAPDRTVWGSDWPHVNWRKNRMMNDAEAVELFYRYVAHDPAVINKVLVDNPARLYGFME